MARKMVASALVGSLAALLLLSPAGPLRVRAQDDELAGGGDPYDDMDMPYDDYGGMDMGMGGEGADPDAPEAHLRGVLDLDELTFDKVRGGGSDQPGARRPRAAPHAGRCAWTAPSAAGVAVRFAHPRPTRRAAGDRTRTDGGLRKRCAPTPLSCRVVWCPRAPLLSPLPDAIRPAPDAVRVIAPAWRRCPACTGDRLEPRAGRVLRAVVRPLQVAQARVRGAGRGDGCARPAGACQGARGHTVARVCTARGA